MGYHDLSDSGMSDSARRDEATRIVAMFPEVLEDMGRTKADFIRRISNNPRMPISTKQLFWLRDLKDKWL